MSNERNVGELPIATGTSPAVDLTASEAPAVWEVQWAEAARLAALMVWRFRNGALKTGVQDLIFGLKPARWRAA